MANYNNNIDDISYPIEQANHRHTFKLLLVENDNQFSVSNEIVTPNKEDKEIHIINNSFYLLRLVGLGKQIRISKKQRSHYSSLNIQLRLIKQQASIHLPSLLKTLKQILNNNSKISATVNKIDNELDQNLSDRYDEDHGEIENLQNEQLPTPKKNSTNKHSSSSVAAKQQQKQKPQQQQKIIYKIENQYNYNNCHENKAAADKMQIESPPKRDLEAEILKVVEKKLSERDQQLMSEFIKQVQQQLQQQQEIIHEYFLKNNNNGNNNNSKNQLQDLSRTSLHYQISSNAKKKKKYSEGKNQNQTSPKVDATAKKKLSPSGKAVIIKSTAGDLNSDKRAEQKLALQLKCTSRKMDISANDA